MFQILRLGGSNSYDSLWFATGSQSLTEDCRSVLFDLFNLKISLTDGNKQPVELFMKESRFDRNPVFEKWELFLEEEKANRDMMSPTPACHSWKWATMKHGRPWSPDTAFSNWTKLLPIIHTFSRYHALSLFLSLTFFLPLFQYLTLFF